MPELTDLSVIRALCEKYDFALSKGFGQNFIINPGQHADAGADLQHAGIRACAGGLRDVPGYPPLNEKVLSHAFGEAEAVAAQQGADVLFTA